MTVVNGEYLRVSARQEMPNGQDHVNVFYWRADFAASQTDQDVADAVIDELDNAYAQLNGIMSNAMLPVDVKIDKVQYVGGEMVVYETVGTFLWTTTFYVPGATGDVLPPGVTGLLKFLTATGKVYGRKFVSGLAEAAQNQGILTSTAVTAFAAMGASILSPYVMSVGNELIAGVMSSKFQLFIPYIETVASANMAYQRRRRLGTGS